MAKANPTQTKDITISSVGFTISMPYAAGPIELTEAEAKTLNQTRLENIGNNLRKQIDALKSEDGTMTDEAQAEAQALVAERDANYIFTVGSVGTSRVTDPLAKECMTLAKGVVLDNIKANDMTLKAYREQEGGEEKYNDLVAQVMEMPAVIAAAKANLAGRSGLTDIKLG